MLHLLYALALLLLLCGACAILAERFTLSPALLPLPVLSGAVVVLYLCGVAGFLRVGAVAVLLALAAVRVVGLVQYRPAGVAAAWKRAASVPGFTLFLGGAAFIWLLFCVQQPMFTQWDEFTAWGLAPKMVVERGAFYVADPVNLKASFTYPATSLITFLFQPFGPWAEWACLAAIDTLALACLDSDYFCINLIDAANGADLWAANGRMTEGKAPRRSSLAPWKRYVSDIEAFKLSLIHI